MGEQPLLLAALQIHSVEARHACAVRRLRGNFLDNVPNRGWITGDETDITLTSAFYAGEQNTVQDGIDIVTLQFQRDGCERGVRRTDDHAGGAGRPHHLLIPP